MRSGGEKDKKQEKTEVGYQGRAVMGKPLCVLGRTDRQQCTGGKNSSRLTVFCFVLFLFFVLLLMIRQQTESRHMAKQVEPAINVESYNTFQLPSVASPPPSRPCRREIFTWRGARDPQTGLVIFPSFLPPPPTSPNHHSLRQHSGTPGLSLTLSPHHSTVVPPLIIYCVVFYNPVVAVFTAYSQGMQSVALMHCLPGFTRPHCKVPPYSSSSVHACSSSGNQHVPLTET